MPRNNKEARVAYCAARRARLVSNGLCATCSKAPLMTATRCRVCAHKLQQENKARYSRRIASSLCVACGERAPVANLTRCQRCADVDKNRRRDLVAAGTCRQCAKSLIKANGKCETCYLKHAALRHLGSTKRWGELRALLRHQEFRCAYSGKYIDLGSGASVEHIRPTSSFPEEKHLISNIVWVDVDVNKAKQALSHDKFLDLCVSVVRHHGFTCYKPTDLE